MRALVTGACGFVGAHLVQHLREHGYTVLGSFIHRPPENLPYQALQLNIRDLEQCRRVCSDFRPEAVFHLAGVAFVPEAEDDFESAMRTNTAGTWNVLKASFEAGAVKRFVYVSSAEVYGRIERLPITEQTARKPANAYSLTKAMAEEAVEFYERRYSGSCVIMRPFNHVGAGQNERFVASNFAQQLAKIAHGLAPARMQVGNLEARRDFSDVSDIVRAYRLAAERGHGIYNLSSGGAVAVSQILKTLCEICGVKIEILPDETRMRPSETPEVYGSFEKAKKELGWQPQISLEDSLRSIYNWWFDKLKPAT